MNAEDEGSTRRVDVLIIGAGFSGLCVAQRLRKGRRLTFKILERARDVGGTWRDNVYPGCACDIPSPLYSYSFAQRTGWTRLFPRQPEILGYLREFARTEQLLPHIHFGAEVTESLWNEARQEWKVTSASGECFVSQFLVSAIGALHAPSIPALPGIQTFEGQAMHSAQWDGSTSFKGKHVAVIGTGASAIQLIPEIARSALHLTVFQRTPHWILPKSDRLFTSRERLLRQFAVYRWYQRWRLFWIHEARGNAFHSKPESMAQIEALARSHIRRQVSTPELREKLTPSYAIGCKRLLISSDYYPALQRKNVTLEDSGIAKVAARSVVSKNGTAHSADIIIYGTGFDVQNGLAEIPVTGRAGRSLSDRWKLGMEAYLGTTVSGFPNYFVMTGPNSGLAHNSQIFMIEAQARYAVSCMQRARDKGLRSVEIKTDPERDYNSWVQELLSKSVWQTGGCTNWYQNATTRRNTLLWPTSVLTFWRKTRRARLADYTCQR